MIEMVEKFEYSENKPLAKQMIDKFGIDTRIDIFIEEMSELIQALSKYKRGKTHNVEEEMVDVMKLWREMELIFDNDLMMEFEELKTRIQVKLLKGELNE